MADPRFKARRRRWLKLWHRARPDRERTCDWCMGHAISGTIIASRADSGWRTFALEIGGETITIRSDDPNFWTIRRIHDRAMRS
jgi:hypothetical protein